MHVPQLGHLEQFRIRTFEIDETRHATFPIMVQLMQEAAMQNVIELGLSVWDMEKIGISWVLFRMKTEIVRLPRVGEKISVVTYPTGFEKFFTYRDYRVYDEEGKEISRATSAWLLMDTTTRKMARIPEHIKAYESKMNDVGDLALPNIALKAKHSFETADCVASYEVRYHDLDFNGHLSNVIYLKQMSESLPVEFLRSNRLQTADVTFRLEGKLDDEITASAYATNDKTWLHRLVNADGQIMMTARTEWIKK